MLYVLQYSTLLSLFGSDGGREKESERWRKGAGEGGGERKEEGERGGERVWEGERARIRAKVRVREEKGGERGERGGRGKSRERPYPTSLSPPLPQPTPLAPYPTRLLRFATGAFSTEYKPTVDVDFSQSNVMVGEQRLRIALWQVCLCCLSRFLSL